VPAAVHNATLPRVREWLKREFDIDYTGKVLCGYTGVDKFFDKEHFGRIARLQVLAQQLFVPVK
jgi:hypothetical protein